MELVPLQLILSILLCGLLIGQFPLRLVLLIDIALIIPSRATAVFAPIPFAEPTKLVSTSTGVLPARHVIASLILFDVDMALRTSLCFGQNPRYILSLRRAFLKPFLRTMTGGREMGLILARPAEAVLASWAFDLFRGPRFGRKYFIARFAGTKHEFLRILM